MRAENPEVKGETEIYWETLDQPGRMLRPVLELELCLLQMDK